MKSSTPKLHPQDFSASGPALIRKFFFPRQRLKLSDLPQVLGLSRDRIYLRIKNGQFDLKIRKDEVGRPFILLEDLIAYLFPEEKKDVTPVTPVSPETQKRPVGRPRKAVGR